MASTVREARAPIKDRPRVKKRRQEVIDAAAEVFYEKGYDAASTQDIADVVGILKGSLYYYVETKEDFLFEVIREAHEMAVEMVEGVRVAEGDVLERLAALIRGHLEFYLANRIKASVFFRDFGALSSSRRSEVDALGRNYRSLVSELIVEGQRAGVVNPDLDPHVAGLALVEMLNSIFRWFHPDGQEPAEQIVQQYVTILMHGFAGGSGRNLPAGRRKPARSTR